MDASFRTPTRGAILAGSPSLCLTLDSFLSTRGSKNGGGGAAFSSETVCQGTSFLSFLSPQPLRSSCPSWGCGNRIPATSYCTWTQSQVSSQATQVICPRCGEQTGAPVPPYPCQQAPSLRATFLKLVHGLVTCIWMAEELVKKRSFTPNPPNQSLCGGGGGSSESLLSTNCPVDLAEYSSLRARVPGRPCSVSGTPGLGL